MDYAERKDCKKEDIVAGGSLKERRASEEQRRLFCSISAPHLSGGTRNN